MSRPTTGLSRPYFLQEPSDMGWRRDLDMRASAQTVSGHCCTGDASQVKPSRSHVGISRPARIAVAYLAHVRQNALQALVGFVGDFVLGFTQRAASPASSRP